MSAIAALVLLAAQAGAPSAIPYATIGGWNVMIDMEVDHGCFISGTFDSGTSFSLGVDRSRRDRPAYVVVSNARWSDLVDGRDYEIDMRFDGDKPWRGPAHATVAGGMSALTVRFEDAAFARQFALRKAVTISRNGAPIAKLELSSTIAALAGMLACQVEVDALVDAIREEEENVVAEARKNGI